MFSESQFIDIYRSIPNLKRRFQDIINETIRSVDYSGFKSYSYEFDDENGEYGVMFFIFGNKIWCWLNSVNTNYSCIFLLLKYINDNFDRKITILDFSSDRIVSTLDYFKDCIYSDRQKIFTPGSSVFKDMFFITQLTWNKGIVSVLSAIFTIMKNYNVTDVNLTYERGNKLDMTRGLDLTIWVDEKPMKTQHKSTKLFDGSDFYTSSNFDYNESTYRNHLDLISIESNGKIYLFYNSTNKELCGTRGREFFIHKSLLIKEMSVQNKEVTDLLIDLNRICYEKNIIFMFERGEDGSNYFEESIVSDKKTIRFFLNDIHDLNLTNMVKEEIEKLK